MQFKNGSSIESDLKYLLNSPENANECGECGLTFPSYCSLNLGVFLCGRCASVHRKILGSREDGATSIVKSLTLDRWSKRDVESVMSSGGNKRNRQFWNPKKEPFPYDGDDDRSAVETYIRNKYLKGKFRYTPVRIEDFNLVESTDELQAMVTGSSHSTLRRGPSRSSLTNNSKEDLNESKPPLPKRPTRTNSPKPAVFDGTGASGVDLISNANGSRSEQFDGNVQQYYDPTTGQVYVDHLQYMKAIQQQQQQLQLQLQAQKQQQELQLQAQQQHQLQLQAQQQQQAAQHALNKANIMSLYQRPDLYTSAVEIKPDNPQYTQLLEMQKQQQFQQQQFQQQQLQQQQFQQQQFQQQQLQQQQLQQQQLQQQQQQQQQQAMQMQMQQNFQQYPSYQYTRY